MKNPDHYSYYRVTGEEAVKLNQQYEPIRKRRSEILQSVIDESGCVGFAFGRGNNNDLLNQLAFDVDHDFGTPVKVLASDELDGRPVVVVQGKGRSEKSKNLNVRLAKIISDANKQLIYAPDYQSYLIKHYRVGGMTMRGSVPGSPFASYMVSTYCGTAYNDPSTRLFAIPNMPSDEKPVSVPDCFEPITYGQFYDLANKK